MTVNPVADHQMLQQMAEMKAELQRFGEKLEKSTSQQQVRSSSPETERRSRLPPRRQQAGGFRQRRPERRDDTQDAQKDTSKEEGTHEGCTRCGFNTTHDHPARCPAYNQTCFYCSKVGHFARCCRKAKRNERPRNQSQPQD